MINYYHIQFLLIIGQTNGGIAILVFTKLWLWWSFELSYLQGLIRNSVQLFMRNFANRPTYRQKCYLLFTFLLRLQNRKNRSNFKIWFFMDDNIKYAYLLFLITCIFFTLQFLCEINQFQSLFLQDSKIKRIISCHIKCSRFPLGLTFGWAAPSVEWNLNGRSRGYTFHCGSASAR